MELFFNEKIKELKKGVNIGYCRICGNYRKLTVNHVPPKACGNNNRIEIIYDNKKLISQNGLNCKTICEECNNILLGSNYDKELIRLYKEIKSFNKSGIIVGKIQKNIDVKKLVRCLLGHLLSICVYEKNNTIQELLKNKIKNNLLFNTYRDFVLGKTDILKNYSCYYWYYPYDNIVITPYFLKADVITGPKILELFGTIIKLFPIALYIIDESNSTAEIDCNKIDFNQNSLTFDINEKIKYDFPELPSKNELIMLSSRASFDVKNKPLKK
jgi:hypothetical protein